MSKGYVSIPVGYKRVDDQPLMNDELFESYETAVSYASTSSTAYVGQVLTVSGSPAIRYQVNSDKTLSPISNAQISFSLSKSPMTINHGLNKYPEVIVIGNEGDILEVNINHQSNTILILSWNGEVEGNVYIK